MTGRTSLLLIVLLALWESTVGAQEPPKITPGYATEGRPGFVDIYSVELVPWQRLDIAGLPKGLQAKMLSRDAKRGAVSLLTYLPIGWKHEKGYHNADEEIFLVEGDLTIGDQKLTKYSYTFIPAGMAHGPVSTRQGAVLVHWFNKTPDFIISDKDMPGARVHAAVRDWNYYKNPWDTANFPVYRKGPPIPGLHVKLLRRDPDTGEMTWMTSSIASTRPGYLWEVHPTFEEYFLVERSGEMVVGECLPEGPVGKKYGDRGYWFRPAGVGHLGPISHSTGYGISLVRSGGPLWADYYTDCSYKQKVELTDDSQRNYKQDKK
jgi:Domain of unknown function (DUF4437)